MNNNNDTLTIISTTPLQHNHVATVAPLVSRVMRTSGVVVKTIRKLSTVERFSHRRQTTSVSKEIGLCTTRTVLSLLAADCTASCWQRGLEGRLVLERPPWMVQLHVYQSISFLIQSGRLSSLVSWQVIQYSLCSALLCSALSVYVSLSVCLCLSLSVSLSVFDSI